MALTINQIQERLARFEFAALFLQDLGWQTTDQPGGVTVNSGLANPGRQTTAKLLACWDKAAVVEIGGPVEASTFTPDRCYPQLNQLASHYSDLLVIWSDSNRQRSLWCWSHGDTPQPYWRTHGVIARQGDGGWAARLAQLQGGLAESERFSNYLSPPSPALSKSLLTGFQHSWWRLAAGLKEIPVTPDRQHYALLILLRMIAMTALQQRGFLLQDDWYLHNQFGRSQQRGLDRFFPDILQPLFQQGFSLPYEERSLPVQKRLGPIPFLPAGPFQPCTLDQRWGHLSIPDTAFEPAISWLGDMLMATAAGSDLADLLQPLLETVVNEYGGAPMATPSTVLEELCDRALHATLLDRVADLTGHDLPSWPALLMTLSPDTAGALLTEVGKLNILDPACGSGRYLVATLRSLMEVIRGLAGIAALDQRVPLPRWVQAKSAGDKRGPILAGQPSPGIVRHLLTRTLYGIDHWPSAVEMARLQLFLEGLKSISTPQELTYLPDLSLTILEGNALIGLVRVDSERFDQIQPKGKRSPPVPASEAEAALQGNLLQPLMADTYQSILMERQVRLEHYRSQTELLAEVGYVPAYAQADFLRERLENLNQIAEAKLNHLLWNECSQQLGIRLQQQDQAGKRQSRLLEPADVEALRPFHWGFYFDQLLRDRGGFDLIVGQFPIGTIQPTEAEFVAKHQALFQQKNVAPSTFRHNARQVLTIDADLNRAWLEYRGQFSFPNQYFRRSDHYPYARPSTPGHSQGRLYWSRLYLERSLELLRPGGRCGVLLDAFWSQANSQELRQWLQASSRLEWMVDLSNHAGLWGDLPSRATLSLLWLRKGGSTRDVPYAAYHRAASAVSEGDLGSLLQRLIDLAEQGDPVA